MAESTYTAPATYTITFPSLSQSEVKVSIDGVLQSSGFTISGYATSGSGTVSFTSAPASGATVRIFRDTTILNNQAPAPKADFQSGASIKASDLNNNMDQVLYKLAEKVDEGDISNDAVTTQAIRDLNVTTDKIDNGAVNATKLATNAVEEAQILAGAVTSAKILDGTIVNDDINASAAIAGTKVSPDFGSQTIATTGNITVTGTVDGRDVSTDGTKLDGIEASATADQTAAEVRTLVDSATDSNVFTDAEKTKLSGIATAATPNQSASDIRALVDSATDSNVFTDSEKTKLTGISAGADVTSTNSINALTDVNTTGVADGKILKYQASSSSFIISEDDGSTSAINAVTTTANTALSRVNTYLHDGTNAVGDGVGSNPQGLAYAIATADTAVTNAGSAATAASNVATTVSTYLHDGTNPAGDGVGSNPQGLAYAINQANTAVTTSNAASALVSSAVFYTLIANFAAFPSSPSNQDRIEVADSSGLESQSIVAGLPSGFTGSSALIVRLQYNSTTSKWDFLQYFASDPEARYFTKTAGNTNTTNIATNVTNIATNVTNIAANVSSLATKMPLAGGTFTGAVSFDDNVIVKGDNTNGSGKLTLNCENNSHGVHIKGPPHSASASYTLTLPSALPSSTGQALTSDTNGNLGFSSVSSDALTTPQTITASKTYDANSNIGLMGPAVSVASSATLTVPSSSVLTIIN